MVIAVKKYRNIETKLPKQQARCCRKGTLMDDNRRQWLRSVLSTRDAFYGCACRGFDDVTVYNWEKTNLNLEID